MVHTVHSLQRLAAAEAWRSDVRRAYAQSASRFARRRLPYYRKRLNRCLRDIIPPGASVLDVGCGFGDHLARLQPQRGVGIDLVEEHVAEARRRYHHLRFACRAIEHFKATGEKFDFILICEALGECYDVATVLQSLLPFCHDRTRLIIVQYSRLWQPAMRLAQWMGIKRHSARQNWLPAEEIRNQLALNGWEVVRQTGVTLAPLYVPLLSGWINRFAANLPLMQPLCLDHILIARPVARQEAARRSPDSVTVVVPARNEAGHIRPLVDRLPDLAPQQEVIFVEGASTDDTWQVIQHVVAAYHGPWTLRAIRQTGRGKADAVRTAFAQSTGDVLFILDADLSVPPEELVTFRDVIASGKAEFANGSRMVYAMDKEAMRFLNLLANRFFGAVFTWLLGQRLRDTLCGTKVLRRSDYERIAAQRRYLGDFDPFGDFDLLFGAARQNLKIIDVPVHYKARTYGQTNISRFRHGWLLLKMCWFAARKIRFV